MNERQQQWRPNVTVAAIAERDGRFLIVEEQTTHGLRYNQPAGHLEAGESLLAAVRRECLEETACAFEPQALVGIYRYRESPDSVTYLRFAFAGRAAAPEAGRRLDDGIVRAVWLSAADIAASRDRHRSPLVARCVEDYLAGRRYPLELLRDGEPAT